jgi:Mu-like prophage protein gp29
LYVQDGLHVTVEAVKVRKRNRFRFDLDGNIRLLTRENALEGEIMPERKFWQFATGGADHENPYGIGLAHWLYWPTFFKNKGVKFWTIFLDKFAMPTALGQHNFGNDQAKIGVLIEALEAIHTDSGVAIPDGVEITLLEAKRSGTTDYSVFSEYMDQAISKVVVGQTMTTDDGSSRSQAEVHEDVRQDLVKADSDLICESWNRGPGLWLTDWNFPGATAPKVTRDVDLAEDLNERSTRDKTIVDMGFKPTLEYITDTYGEGWEESEIPPPNLNPFEPGPGDDPDDPEFAAPRTLPGPTCSTRPSILS